MRVFEAIAEQIARADVRDVFTFMSRDTAKLIAELSARGLNVYHTRHEHVAVGMADGYARVAGTVGVAIVGQGVGLTNAMNALVTAAKAHSGIVVFVGEAPGAAQSGATAAKLMLKYIDQRGLLDRLRVSHLDLQSPESAPADVRACFEFAANDGEALVVSLPEDLIEAEAGDAPSRIAPDTPPRLAELSGADRSTILDVLEEGWASSHTVILAGRGAVRSGARTELLRLGEATGALLGTTVMAKGLFDGSPHAIGIVGTFATPIASELLRTADLVLAFGASLNYHTTYLGKIFGKARIVQFDRQPTALGRYQAVDLAVVADARLAAAALADELERKGHHVDGYRTQETSDRTAQFRSADTFTDRSTPTGLDPRTLMVELNRILPSERTVVVDAGNFMEYPIVHLSVPDAAGFVWPNEYGAVGCGLGNALGAAVARPDRLAVLCIGDGGLMMMLGDLDTAARYRMPLLVIVCNDSALGAELHHLRENGYSGHDAQYENPSFEAVARSLGFEAATIRRIGDVEALRERVTSSRGPMLVDCRINTEPADFLSFQSALFSSVGRMRDQAQLVRPSTNRGAHGER